MKPKTTILMVLAIGCGLAAAFMTNKLIAERNKPAEDVKKITVLVAKKKIAAMSFIKKVDEFFEPQERNENDVPKSALTALDDKDVKDGFRVSRPFPEGTVLTRDDLISKEMEGLARVVPHGMRAFATRVTAESLAGGFVLPGSKVDVVWTFRTTDSKIGSLTILQDMLVMAVDTQSARNPENPQTILGTTVTLAVKPEEAQKLSLAALNGDLRLALRNVTDDKKVQLSASNVGDLAKQTQDTGEEKTDPSASESASSASAVTTVPPIPALPAPVMKDPTPTPVVVAEEPKPKRIHILRVEDGPNVTTHQFPFNEETQSYDGIPVKRKEVEPK